MSSDSPNYEEFISATENAKNHCLKSRLFHRAFLDLADLSVIPNWKFMFHSL